MTSTDIADAILWDDHIYRNSIKRRKVTDYPVTPVLAPRKLWHTDAESRIRHAINDLSCGQSLFIEGIHVERTDAHKLQKYYVARGKSVKFEQAVKDVLKLAYPVKEGIHE